MAEKGRFREVPPLEFLLGIRSHAEREGCMKSLENTCFLG